MQKSRNILTKIVLFFVFFICISSFAYSNVEVFSNYDTVLKVNTVDNMISVNKSLTLKNVYDVGIVPGQIEFKIAKGVDGSVANIEIVNVSAKDRFGKDINVRVRNTQDYSVIILDIYYPLLPGFEYNFNLFYSLSYNPGGIFFKSLQIPIRESTIPIEKGKFNVVLPDNYHFTYLGDESDQVKIERNVATWDIENNIPNSVVFEYSWIPIKFGEFKGSYIFWISINLALLLVLFFEVRREIKNLRKRNGG